MVWDVVNPMSGRMRVSAGKGLSTSIRTRQSEKVIEYGEFRNAVDECVLLLVVVVSRAEQRVARGGLKPSRVESTREESQDMRRVG